VAASDTSVQKSAAKALGTSLAPIRFRSFVQRLFLASPSPHERVGASAEFEAQYREYLDSIEEMWGTTSVK